jgi:hypothetical protein
MKRFKLIVFFLVTIITLITVIGCFRHPSNKIKVPAKPPKGVEIKGFE